MNSFKNLTCGVKFSKSRIKQNFKNEKKKKENGVTNVESFEDFDEIEIKSEPEDDYIDYPTNNGHDSSNSFDFSASDIEIKEEPMDSENEQEFLVTSLSANQKRKKKKKKLKELTPEQIKKAEENRINQLRKDNNVKIRGDDVPPLVLTFQDLYEKYEISSTIKKNMNEIGYEKPTPIQMQAIPVLLEGRQIRGCAPTGSGKTTAFLLPIIQNIINDNKINPDNVKKIRALIICPTRELAAQILRECVRLCNDTDVRAHIIKNTDDDYLKTFHKKQTNILIVTPNRLCYIIKKGFSNFNLSSVQWIIIDEVDKLFEESKNDFQEELGTLVNACTHPERKFGVFSATTSSPIVQWTHQTLINFVTVKIGMTNTPIDAVEQELLYVGNESGKLLAVRDIIKKGVSPPVLIFVQSKDRAQQLFTELIYDGLNIDLIHSDRSQKERDVVVRKFREGKIWFLICTELMSRGIDFKGVNVVINYDFPQSTISYIHRIGRTGRAGKSGKAITFFTTEDKKFLRDVAAIIKKSGGTVPDYMLSLKKSRKKDRVALMQKAPKRKAITTLPQFELSQRKRKKKFVSMSKAKKKKIES